MFDETFQSMLVEIRRGTLSLAVLCSLLRKPMYGYALLEFLEEQKINIEAGTLYPLLRRMEKQGLLTSQWDTRESRPRKYYYLSSSGKQMCTQLWHEWNEICSCLNTLMEKENTHESMD